MKKIEHWLTENAKYVLLAIIALSTALRLYHINYQSLWLDELYSIVPTDPKNSLASIVEYSKSDQPPLFFIYIHYVFSIFGYDEVVGRLACAFTGILGVIAVYFLGNEIGEKRVGLFASFLTGISYFHIYYSQELRFYSLAFLFAVLSYLFFIKAFKKNKTIDFIGYTFFTSCLLYTHYFGIIILCTQIITFIFLLRYKRDIKFIIGSMASGMMVMISFIPWVPIVITDSGIASSWMRVPGLFFIAEYFYDYVGKDAATTVILLVLLFLFFKSLRTKNSNPERRPVYLILILWIFFSYLIPYLRSLTSAPLLHPRYTIVTLPAWIVIFAIGWDSMENYRWKYAIPLLLVTAVGINALFFKQQYTRLEKHQFREASRYVKSNNQSHLPIYSTLGWHYNYYFRDTPDHVENLQKSDLSTVYSFWLLQGHFSTDDQQAEIDGLMDRFVIIEKHPYYGANAILLERKKPTE